MANINKIRISGSTFDIEDKKAARTVTLTQEEYDALVEKDPNVFYVISDSSINYVTSAETQSAITQAVSGKQDTLVSSVNIKTINNESLLGSGNITIQGGGGSTYTAGDGIDITNDVISVTGKADTSAVTEVSDALTAHTANTTVHVTAQDKAAWNAKSDFSGSYNDLTNKLSAGTNITIVDNVISAEGGGGGGKAVVGGRGITVTSGETADTVSFNLPISADTNSTNIKGGNTNCVSSGNQSFAFGYKAAATASNSIAFGYNLTSSGEASFACGGGNKAIGWYSFAGGSDCNASGNSSLAFGSKVLANNNLEASFGRFNASSKASNTFGNSGNTLFSVGNGTSNNARHNAFEIRQNGDIYLNDGSKLQDTITATASNTTALGGLSLVKLSQAQYEALATKDNSTLYVIVN